MGKKCIVKIKGPYRFRPLRDRNDRVTKYEHLYTENQDFTVNPVLMQQIGFENCPETTPEGKALWLYMRLCQLLKFDETTFYNKVKRNPNNDIEDSFRIVGNVTAETPVSCFNFVRIATKLLNQIDGVHAVMIMVGKIKGHLRFGFYTDKITVDCEPTTSINHFNDMALAKLGIMPKGPIFMHGKWYEANLMQKVMGPMLASQRGLQQYLNKLYCSSTNMQMSYLPTMVDYFRQYGVDGNSAVQALLDLNRNHAEMAYQLLRVGMVKNDCVDPQLLVRSCQDLRRIDLNQMQIYPLSVDELLTNLEQGKMVCVDENEYDTEEELAHKRHLRECFVYGLKTQTQGLEH